jgi:hypothetical protein
MLVLNEHTTSHELPPREGEAGCHPAGASAVDGSWLVGYVQLRAVSHGNDAATAIAEMSAFAAAARATDVAVFYEIQDVAIACDHVPLQSGTAMVAVEASPDERVIYRFPYAENGCQAGRRAA